VANSTAELAVAVNCALDEGTIHATPSFLTLHPRITDTNPRVSEQVHISLNEAAPASGAETRDFSPLFIQRCIRHRSHRVFSTFRPANYPADKWQIEYLSLVAGFATANARGRGSSCGQKI
jgi:hypothetical protein